MQGTTNCGLDDPSLRDDYFIRGTEIDADLDITAATRRAMVADGLLPPSTGYVGSHSVWTRTDYLAAKELLLRSEKWRRHHKTSVSESELISTALLLANECTVSCGTTRRRHPWIRTAIELIMSDPVAAREKLRAMIEEAVREVSITTSTKWDGHSIAIELGYRPPSRKALAHYAFALLLDEQGGLAGKLRRCALEGCDCIFLSTSSGKGGRPALYCTPAHQALASRLTGPARTAKWRKRKRKDGTLS
jgi:hypothetical protein